MRVPVAGIPRPPLHRPHDHRHGLLVQRAPPPGGAVLQRQLVRPLPGVPRRDGGEGRVVEGRPRRRPVAEGQGGLGDPDQAVPVRAAGVLVGVGGGGGRFWAAAVAAVAAAARFVDHPPVPSSSSADNAAANTAGRPHGRRVGRRELGPPKQRVALDDVPGVEGRQRREGRPGQDLGGGDLWLLLLWLLWQRSRRKRGGRHGEGRGPMLLRHRHRCRRPAAGPPQLLPPRRRSHFPPSAPRPTEGGEGVESFGSAYY